MTIAAGIDIGSGAVKAALFDVTEKEIRMLGKDLHRVRQRDPFELARVAFDGCLDQAGIKEKDVQYVATTGDGETIPFRTGHFYTMTTHARGAIYLRPEARAVLDVGALNGRAIKIDERGKVLTYKMTSQCASGSGQFLENIGRYLGIAQDEIGELSQKADNPEKVSSICAVLAETDVINMVSREISGSNILKGIHLSMAGRLSRLLKAVGADGTVMITGGLANDSGLVAALVEDMRAQKMMAPVLTHEDSIYAGAIGAALWGAYRYEKLKQIDALPIAS